MNKYEDGEVYLLKEESWLDTEKYIQIIKAKKNQTLFMENCEILNVNF